MYLSSFLYIVQAHSHSIFNVAVRLTLTPVLQKAKKQYFSKRFEASSVECDFYKI